MFSLKRVTFSPKKSTLWKIFLYFLKRKLSYISGNEILHFPAKARKIKKIHHNNIYQEKAFLIYTSGNSKPEKKIIFSKESFSDISENGNPEKIPQISEKGTFRAQKWKKPTLRNISYTLGEPKPNLFLVEPVFHRCFFRCFHFTADCFYYCFCVVVPRVLRIWDSS